jgi:tetrahydromethanopterin S-methyltransferase subunit B
MNHVVLCVQPSVRAASQAHQDDVGTSLVSVSNTLHGVETHTAAELVRDSAREFAPLLKHMGGERAPWLAGSRVNIVDGHCLEASEHRMKALREATGRALPGTSLVVYEPALGVVTDVFPCDNGHAQERSLFGAVLDTVEAGDLWIEDRNVCPRDVLCEIDKRGAFFVTRAHQGVPCEMLPPLRSYGRTPTGHVAQQRVCVVDAHGHTPIFRRLRLKLNEATRDGATIIHILTHVPRQVSANQVAALDRTRWTLDTAFTPLEAYFHAAINTFGYPKAAFFGFCLALVASNVLAVVLAALRRVHGEETVDAEVSLYSIAHEITTTSHGMMIAIPAPEWDVFSSMSTADVAAILVELAQGVRLQAFRKSPRRPKKPHPQGKTPARKGHVSTAKLLMNRKANLVTP